MSFFDFEDLAFMEVAAASSQSSLIDGYPGAVAAYSLRRLRADTASVVRVRRSADNAEEDFTAEQVEDGTLESFCGTGNGFVRTWYDQSGSGNHATQVTALNQPRLVVGGQLVLDESKPALSFDGLSQRLDMPQVPFSMNSLSVNVVCRLASSSEARVLFSSPDGNRVFVPALIGSSFYVGYANSATQFSFGASSIGARYLWQLNAGGSTANAWRNEAPSTPVVSSPASNTGEFLSLGSYEGLVGLGNYWSGTAQEVLFYLSDQTANRIDLASNINSHYSIY